MIIYLMVGDVFMSITYHYIMSVYIHACMHVTVCVLKFINIYKISQIHVITISQLSTFFNYGFITYTIKVQSYAYDTYQCV